MKRTPRMTPVDSQYTRMEAAAALIATVGTRKGYRRWKMSTQAVRNLIQLPLRDQHIRDLTDCLAEYEVAMIRVNDLQFGFMFIEATKNWPSSGLSVLTDVERSTPDVEALEDEIGYPAALEQQWPSDLTASDSSV